MVSGAEVTTLDEAKRLGIPTVGLWAGQSSGGGHAGERGTTEVEKLGESESGFWKSRPRVVTGRALCYAHFQI